MEDLKASQKIIDLGKSIVKELELDPGVDTLSKWMAHYVAEKIELTEKLTGDKRTEIEKECFETILKLWEHRWQVLGLKNHFKDFEPLFETLEKLNPNRKSTFFLNPSFPLDSINRPEKEEFNQAKLQFDYVLSIDRIARLLIKDLLNQAVCQILTKEKKDFFKNSSELFNSLDLRIIELISTNNYYVNEDNSKGTEIRKERIVILKNKIKQLEEFDSIKNLLLRRYNDELAELEKIPE